MALNPNPAANFTPANVDWLVWQLSEQALPAIAAHIALVNRYRNKINAMLDETSWNATQRAEATALLDNLCHLGIVYAGLEENEQDRPRVGYTPRIPKSRSKKNEQLSSTGENQPESSAGDDSQA